MPGNSGSNKAPRAHGDKTAQPWFKNNLAKRRRKDKMAKQSKRKNRKK
jgi:hypothetical protein